MTLFVCRIDRPNYSMYDFIEEMEMGHQTFSDRDDLEAYIMANLFKEGDPLLHPKDVVFRDDDEYYLFIIDTRSAMNWIVKLEITLSVTNVEMTEVDNEAKKK